MKKLTIKFKLPFHLSDEDRKVWQQVFSDALNDPDYKEIVNRSIVKLEPQDDDDKSEG